MSPDEMAEKIAEAWADPEFIAEIRDEHDAALHEAVSLIGYDPSSELGGKTLDGLGRVFRYEGLMATYRDTNVLVRPALGVAIGLGEDVDHMAHTG